MHEKILLVDDEVNILQAIRRNLQHRFKLVEAVGAEQALALLKSDGPFAVVISDLRMPGMDGIKFLSLVREQYPALVRMMLTGHADLQAAIDAVNEGNIFRLLTKPCPPEMLSRVLTAGLKQYRLACAEKDLLEKTLHGSVKVLADVLALTNPTAFGRATRLTRLARMVIFELQIQDAWIIELAAMLSQLGCVTVPENVLQKAWRHELLTPADQDLLDAHPRVGRDLIANIPRLEEVAEIIGQQHQPYDPQKQDTVPLGARILRAVGDFDTLVSNGIVGREAIEKMQRVHAGYDSKVLAALNDAFIRLEAGAHYQLVELSAQDLRPGMIFAVDVFTKHNVLLIARGQDVTTPIILRLRNFISNAAVNEPFKMLVET